MNVISVLTRKKYKADDLTFLSLSLSPSYKLLTTRKRGPSPESNDPGTLILDFWSLK